LNPDLQKVLLALIDAAGDNAQQVRENIEGWFNSTMDRVSGWYRRRTQMWIVVFGFVLAALLNADTIAIFRYLSVNEKAREALVKKAEQTLVDESSAVEAIRKKEGGTDVGSGTATTPGSATTQAPRPTTTTTVEKTIPAKGLQSNTSTTIGSSSSVPPAKPKSEEQKLKERYEQINALGVPLGWKKADCDMEFSDWLSRILGILLTTTAIALGAPFWFDLLNMFMNVRSAMKASVKPKSEEGKP
jgi:hypothetical protein